MSVLAQPHQQAGIPDSWLQHLLLTTPLITNGQPSKAASPPPPTHSAFCPGPGGVSTSSDSLCVLASKLGSSFPSCASSGAWYRLYCLELCNVLLCCRIPLAHVPDERPQGPLPGHRGGTRPGCSCSAAAPHHQPPELHPELHAAQTADCSTWR